MGTLLGTDLCAVPSGPPPPAPTGLTYSTNPASYTQGVAITPNTPTVTGTVTSYTVLPALPSGLIIGPATGIIVGTPTVAAASAVYVVTATNAGGFTTCNLTLDVAASADPIPALLPHTRLRADMGITLNVGNVQVWTDPVSGRAFQQLTGTAQPLFVATEAALNNMPAVSFDGTSDSLVSTVTAASGVWNFLHNGAGAEVWMVHVYPTGGVAGHMFATTTSGGTGVWVGAGNTVSRRFELTVLNAATACVNVAQANAYNYDVGSWDQWSLITGTWQWKTNLLAGSTGTPSALASGNPSHTLWLGTRAGGGAFSTGRVAEIIVFDRVLTAGERTTITSYLTTRYGI